MKRGRYVHLLLFSLQWYFPKCQQLVCHHMSFSIRTNSVELLGSTYFIFIRRVKNSAESALQMKGYNYEQTELIGLISSDMIECSQRVK